MFQKLKLQPSTNRCRRRLQYVVDAFVCANVKLSGERSGEKVEESIINKKFTLKRSVNEQIQPELRQI